MVIEKERDSRVALVVAANPLKHDSRSYHATSASLMYISQSAPNPNPLTGYLSDVQRTYKRAESSLVRLTAAKWARLRDLALISPRGLGGTAGSGHWKNTPQSKPTIGRPVGRQGSCVARAVYE